MGSCKRPGVFDPLDLQIIEAAYEAAWAEIVSHDPFRDTAQDNERKLFLRKLMFATAWKGKTELAVLADRVLSSMPQLWIPPVKMNKPPRRVAQRRPLVRARN
jgi:hypothetical protein